MKALLRTLALIACLFLTVQTVRHTYVLWLEPRASVLDKFDRPLKDEIAAATSVDALLKRYEPVRNEVERIKAERRAADPKAEFADLQDTEPFKSETSLREAISNWEQRAKELHSLRFYWLVGLVFAVAGLVAYRANGWVGTVLLIIGFSEIIYWTTPSLFSGGVQEFDRLVATKLVLSAISLVLLVLAIRLLGPFRDSSGRA
jgi:hypothetical protein